MALRKSHSVASKEARGRRSSEAGFASFGWFLYAGLLLLLGTLCAKKVMPGREPWLQLTLGIAVAAVAHLVIAGTRSLVTRLKSRRDK